MLLLVSTRVYFTRFVLYGWYDILQFTSRKTYLNVPKARKDLLYYVGQREVVLHENTIQFFFNPDPSNCSMHSFLVAMSCGLEEKY